MDGASSSTGAGIGIVLEGPYKAKLKYVVKLAFQASNDVAEYEVILMALCIIKEVRAQEVDIFYDSQLVVNQLQGNYQVRDPNLGKYQLRIQSL